MRFFGVIDVTDFGNQENLSLSLLHLQPAFGLLIVSFWHTQLGVEGFLFRVTPSVDCTTSGAFSRPKIIFLQRIC